VEYRKQQRRSGIRNNRYRNWRSGTRSGLAALEVVMTTVISMVIFSFATFWIIRLCRYLFSLIGEMTGSPLL
jgi:Flp pilus assembly protein TadB